MPNIILVGFPGAGKTTIGKKIAERLNRRFVDLDEAIENRYHITIPRLFQRYGESAFRKCEHITLTHVLQSDHLVLSTGGGTPCYENNMILLNANGLTVYIRMTIPSLIWRLQHGKKNRPNTDNLDETELTQYVQQTFPLREPYYLQAKIILKGEHFDLETAVETIRRHE